MAQLQPNAKAQPTMSKRREMTEHQVRQELERLIAEAGGVNALARAAGISSEPIVRARKRGGAFRPVVLTMLRIRKRTTYERF
jgi:DNA-binding phage protein